MKFQKTFIVNTQKSSLIFDAGFENPVTFSKIYVESIWEFHNRKVSKNSN